MAQVPFYSACFAHEPQAERWFTDPAARRLHLIRHGQAGQQLVAGERPESTCLCNPPRPAGAPNPCPYLAPALIDAPLTPFGHEQVRGKGAHLGAQLLLVSPLTRALQTIAPCFENGTPPVVVESSLRPRIGPHMHTRRRPTAALETAFPHLDFSGVPATDTRWTPRLEPRADFDARVFTALCTIMQRPQRNIAVITHFTTLFAWLRPPSDHRLLGPNPSRDDSGPAFLDGRLSDDPEALSSFLAPGEVRTLVVVPGR